MSEIFKVKEFETIIGKYEYKDQYTYMDKGDFINLVEFIHTFGVNEESDVLYFIKIGYKRNIGKTLIFKNYVGLIQLNNNFQIEILPKISFLKGEKDETKKIFIKMLRSMNNFPSKTFSNANLNLDKMNLYDVFINMYLQEVMSLVKKGLSSAYMSREENLNLFKGKLLLKEQIKNNIAHKEKFYVEYDEFLINRAENRLIKSTLLKLQKITRSSENSKEIRKSLTAFELVKPSINYEKDFSKIIINKNTKNYELLMKWSRVFLYDKSFTTFSGDENARALLFPMERVFESYVAKNMKKIFSQNNWKVSSQDKGHYLFNTINGERHKKFGLRPDLVATSEDGRIIIFDTKWKRLIDNKSKNYGISQADMYQMYAYAKKYKTSETCLLYPTTEEIMINNTINFNSGDGVTVSVFFINLSRIEESMEELLQYYK